MPEELQKRSIWVGIIERAVTIIVALFIGAMWLGGTRQKVAQKVLTLEMEMTAWKQEWKEASKHITKMDLEGSVATKNFVAQYEKEEAKWNERVKKLEDEVRHLELMKAQIDRLERKLGDPPPKGTKP